MGFPVVLLIRASSLAVRLFCFLACAFDFCAVVLLIGSSSPTMRCCCLSARLRLLYSCFAFWCIVAYDDSGLDEGLAATHGVETVQTFQGVVALRLLLLLLLNNTSRSQIPKKARPDKNLKHESCKAPYNIPCNQHHVAGYVCSALAVTRQP